ncbi:hypothetical protein [Rhizobium sp. CF142]|uniref:hypothetical protein n=1 Tax=Rhizobium sp. CF142 TaxID=1144314 RepID=UPI00026EF90F|nr:hypothetical protein [Rhizobium sp. CF142]EJJ31233.1 hypothetical protein PMI11_00505 [Rhizobium sp. CF142]
MTIQANAQVPSRKPTARGASHVMAGFRYQVLQSVQALVSLREGEELLLEVSEDFTVVSKEAVDDVQVKNSQAESGPTSFSFQSPDIAAALNRFWETSDAARAPRRLIFISRGGAAVERHHLFPDNMPGLRYWRTAAIDADTLPLRTALISILGASPLGQWIESEPTDAELRERLLRRVQWELDAASADELFSYLREQIGEIYHSRNLPVICAKPATASLIDLVFETASKPRADNRRLSKIDLAQIMEECAAAHLVAQAVTGITQPSLPVLIESAVVSELEYFTSVATRREALDAIANQTRGQPLVWIHGTNGIGKSTLARLAATAAGGRWLELDLRPFQTDKAGSVAAWAQLTRAIALSEPYDGIIIDDFEGAPANALRSRLKALAQSFGGRGARLIVTSHHQPTPAYLSDCRTSVSSSFQAPYFSEDDAVEMVRVHPAPRENMVLPWAKFLQLTTSGGHPLMVAAKSASLRAQGWPDSSLADDVVKPGEALRVTREEARRALLSDLSSLDTARSLDAGDLLRRVACVFDRVDEGLIRKLGHATPALRTAGDAFAVLKGSWLEELPGGDLRISPLLADIGKEVTDEERKLYRWVAAEYWASDGPLDARTLPLCFWNAFLGGHAWVLMQLCVSISSMPAETLRGAAALLAPMAVLTTDRPLLPSNLAVSIQLRLLQFEVADATEQGPLAATIASRLVQELDLIEDGHLRVLFAHTSMTRFLMAESAKLATQDRIAYALMVRKSEPRILDLGEGNIPDPKTLLPSEFGDEMDAADILFANIVRHIDSSSAQLEAVQALNAISQEDRNRFLDAMSTIYEGDSVFVHSGWSKDQLGDGDMEVALANYGEFQQIASGWNRDGLLLEVICAQAVILDEGLGRTDDALALVDHAIGSHGRNTVLLRQKSKLLAHAGRHGDAVEVMIPIEADVAARSPFDRALALLDGAIWAAKAGRFPDAIRMISGAEVAIFEVPGRIALAIGMMLEEALIRWRSDDRAGAIRVTAEALEAISLLPDDESFQALRSHKLARGMVGLFLSELPGMPAASKIPITFGTSTVLQSETKAPAKEALTAIPDHMRILAVIEVSLGLDVGVERRSSQMLSGSTVPRIELMLRQRQYENATRSGDPAAALRSGITVLWAYVVLQGISRDQQIAGRIDIERYAVPAISELRSLPEVDQKLDLLVVDFVLYAKLSQKQLNTSFWTSFRAAVETVFGDGQSLERLIDLLEGKQVNSAPASGAYAMAYVVGMTEEQQAGNPALRFQRDVRILQHIAQSASIDLLASVFIENEVRHWTFVLESQRFLLHQPSANAPAIGAALEFLSGNRRLVNVARLFAACAPAVGIGFDTSWIESLDRLWA